MRMLFYIQISNTVKYWRYFFRISTDKQNFKIELFLLFITLDCMSSVADAFASFNLSFQLLLVCVVPHNRDVH